MDAVKQEKPFEESLEKKPVIKSTNLHLFKPLLIFTLLVLVFLGAIWFYLFNISVNRIVKTVENSDMTKSLFPSPSLIVSPTTKLQPSVKQEKKLVLKRTDGDKEKVIVSYASYQNRTITRWGNWLFYEKDNNVVMEDIKTGESKILYQSATGGDNRSGSLYALQVFDNTLFFSYGEYITKHPVYWLDLPQKGQPQILKEEAENGGIIKIRDKYYLVESDGDACVGWGEYSLLDISVKKLTFLVSVKSGCASGDEYLGVDLKDRMILAHHEVPKEGEKIESPFFNEFTSTVYKYVYAISVTNPAVREGIIAAQNMPKDVAGMFYLEDQNEILILGKAVTIYHLNSDQMEIIIDSSPKELSDKSFLGRNNDSLCFGSYYDTKYAEINITTKKLIAESQNCTIFLSPTPQPTSTEFSLTDKELIDFLTLPKNYKFVLE